MEAATSFEGFADGLANLTNLGGQVGETRDLLIAGQMKRTGRRPKEATTIARAATATDSA